MNLNLYLTKRECLSSYLQLVGYTDNIKDSFYANFIQINDASNMSIY